MKITYDFPQDTIEVESQHFPEVGDTIHNFYGVAFEVVRKTYSPYLDQGHIVCEQP